MWKQNGSVLTASYKWGEQQKIPSGKAKLYIYDLDHTVILPSEGKRFSNTAKDWKFFTNATKGIKAYNKDPTHITFIVTNQNGLNSEARIQIFKEKVEKVLKDLDIPIILFAALEKDIYRKPNDGIMRNHIVPVIQSLDVDHIMAVTYVGDAAGRPGDFSGGDRKWLYNVKLYLQSNLSPEKLLFSGKAYFKTPEQMFLNKNPEPFAPNAINLGEILGESRTVNGKKVRISELNTGIDYLKTDHEDQEVILTIGEPGGGKSQIAKQVVDEWGYISLSQDDIGPRRKVVQLMEQKLDAGHSIIIDNTFPDLRSRSEYISAIQEYFKRTKKPVHIRAFVINGQWSAAKRRAFAIHMNNVRMRLGGKCIPMIAYNVYRKKYVPPNETEGFTEIVNTKFLPRFTSPAHVLAFNQLTEIPN